MFLNFKPIPAEQTYTMVWNGQKYRFRYEMNPHEVPDELGKYLLAKVKHLFDKAPNGKAQAPVVKKGVVKAIPNKEDVDNAV